MKRQDGYLQINDSLNQHEIDIIDTRSITKIGAATNQWIKFNGKRYFIKNSEDWERELICSVFLRNLGIKTIGLSDE